MPDLQRSKQRTSKQLKPMHLKVAQPISPIMQSFIHRQRFLKAHDRPNK